MQSISDRSSGLFEIQPTSSAPIYILATASQRVHTSSTDTLLCVCVKCTREPVFDFNPHDV